ncbi:MAG TPA: GNAT family N-acetyltransferase [Vicinamibacterales bacterium]|jgi:ribosomal protein S18 acetylase RimI-like enzyme|nr:GNAT family N-acetyltransferase [Vicinamibacterales bacterium]
MNLRPATTDDAERIVRFWQDSGASMGPTDSVEQVRRAVTHPAALLIVAEAEQEMIGTLLGTFDGWRGNMYRLVVHPDWRRQGIGRQLVKRVEQFFAERGARRITVLIEADRPWAVAFWTAAGYPYDDRIVRHVGTMVNLEGAEELGG